MRGLTEKFKDEIETQANLIYENTIIKKIPTYLKKLVNTYPGRKHEILTHLTQNFPHKDRPQIIPLLVYQRFAMKLAGILEDKGQLNIEERVYKIIIENMANLDVDIKIRLRRGTHLVKTNSTQADKKVGLNNIFQKVETRDQYRQKMLLRNQDEKEIKVELMMTLFLQNLNEKISHMNSEGTKSIERFTDFLMSLCCDKILTVPNSNFI